ncbi:MAG: hypothetical protein LBR73_10035 [Oscillospiraceae bacterium]|jgi:hypothetical protein|nr:hypothetical protein [Oscillospiraceae bacterium]
MSDLLNLLLTVFDFSANTGILDLLGQIGLACLAVLPTVILYCAEFVLDIVIALL